MLSDALGLMYWLRRMRNHSNFARSCCFIFLSICAAKGQTAPLLHSKGLHADVTILREAFEDLHPGLYRYNNKQEVADGFAELNREFDHDQSLQDAFLAFSVFTAKIRCGHTQANPFNQSKKTVQTLFKGTNRVPFYFEWIDGHMVTTRDFSPHHAFVPGTEVVSINGIAVQAILARLMTIARADGSNDSKRVAQLGGQRRQ